VNCEEATRLVDGYLDGELDPIANQRIERHLRDCRNCELAYKNHGALLRAIAHSTSYFKAPAELRGRIQSSLRSEIGAKAARSVTGEHPLSATPTQAARRLIVSEMPWNWLALAAAVILAAIIVSSLMPRTRPPAADEFLATQLISSHVRSLMANHLTDVASSDQHTVKPWLDARLDFAPAVVDLASDGFPLVGGRLDYLDNRPVAALIYQRRKHFINLFIWPAAAGAPGTTKNITRQGYQLLHWVYSDFNFWAVSDVSDHELQAFRQLFEKQM
jgi:anti-sigma factor RsiW